MLRVFSRRSLSGLLVLSLLVSSLAIFPQTASAASPYDNTITTVDEVILENFTSYEICQPVDVTSTWSNIMLNSESYNAAWTHELFGADSASIAADFNTALDNQTGWAVSQMNYSQGLSQGTGATFDNSVNIQFTPSPTAYVDFGTIGDHTYAYMRNTDGAYVYNVKLSVYKPTDGECRVGVSQTTRHAGTNDISWINSNLGAQNFSIASDWQPEESGFIATSQPLFIATDIAYPDDYEGVYPPDTVDVSEKPIKKPDFTYQLNNKEVKAHDYANELPIYDPDTAGYYFVGYKVEWILYKCNPWDPYPMNLCTDSEIVDYQQLPQESDYVANADDYGEYMLEAKYLTEQCYDYDGVPDVDATPDYCSITSPLVEVPEINWLPTQIYLNINGQSITGDTTGQTCDASGFCQVDSTMCYSEEDFITQLTCRFTKSFNTGLINPSINAFKNLLTSLVVPSNPTCNIPLGNVAIAPGKVFPLSTYSEKACASAAQFRSAFPIGPLLINFFLAMTLLVLLVRIINRLLDHQKNDLIEGIH